jgi:hypothetical protein
MTSGTQWADRTLQATIEDINGVTYVNCGDWVESCTAIVECTRGELSLVEWAKDSMWLLNEQEQVLPLELDDPRPKAA